MYSLRGTTPYGNMPSAYFSNDNYGRIAEGNLNNSYGPWIDPELQRVPHRRSVLNTRRHRHHRSMY